MISLSIRRHALLLAAFLISCASPALAADPVGKVTRVQGWAVEIAPDVGVNRLAVGTPVHPRGQISTGSKSRLEVTFDDGSKLILGENAHTRLDKFAQGGGAAKTEDSQIVRMFKGTFRFITGLIGKRSPSRVQVATRLGTIGIRGTDFFGGPLYAGMPPGQLHYGFMIIDGAIEVDTPHGNVTLDDPSEGTFLPMAGGKAPTPPSVWGREAIDEAYASVSFD